MVIAAELETGIDARNDGACHGARRAPLSGDLAPDHAGDGTVWECRGLLHEASDEEPVVFRTGDFVLSV